MPLELISNVIGKALLEFHKERTAETGATMTDISSRFKRNFRSTYILHAVYVSNSERATGR